MGKNKKRPAMAKKPAQKSATVTPIKGEQKTEAPKTITSAELSKRVQDALGDDAQGFAFVVAGADGAIVPFVGGRSIGDLLTLQFVLNKEIARVVESVAYPRQVEGDATPAVQ